MRFTHELVKIGIGFFETECVVERYFVVPGRIGRFDAAHAHLPDFTSGLGEACVSPHLTVQLGEVVDLSAKL